MRALARTWCWLQLVAACANEAHEGTPSDATVTDAQAPAEDGWGWMAPEDAATYAPTFYAVYYEVLLPSCALVFCHAADGYYTLATPERAYRSLVDVSASSQECAGTGLVRVKPGHPEESLLYLKITSPPCGELMPLSLGTSIPLEARRIEQIRQWIEAGAQPFEQRDGGDADSSDTGL